MANLVYPLHVNLPHFPSSLQVARSSQLTFSIRAERSVQTEFCKMNRMCRSQYPVQLLHLVHLVLVSNLGGRSRASGSMVQRFSPPRALN